jgi:hypothetical protein
MKSKNLILTGGIINILFTVFHIGFYWLFKWQYLAQSSYQIYAMLIMLNVGGILIIALMAYTSFFHIEELLTTKLGKALLVFFSLFYIIRIIEQGIFFNMLTPNSIVISLLCLIPAVCYLVPVLRKTNN